MSKITTSEIEKWSEFFWEFTKRYINTERFKSHSYKEQKLIQDALVASYIEAKKGNSVAINFLTFIVEEEFVELPTDLWVELCFQLPQLANFNTSWDYTKQIKKRLIEHHIARGYYQPDKPLSLEEFEQKIDKVGWGKKGKFSQDKNYRLELLAEMSEEDYRFIWRAYSYTIKMEKIIEDNENKITEAKYQKNAFYLEDIVKTLEAAQTKLEQKKKKKTILLHHLQLPPILTSELSAN